MIKQFLTILLFVLFLPFVCHSQERIILDDWLRHAENFLDRTDSYTALFHKQERVKGYLKTKETVYLGFKKPFKIYMKWVEGPGKGREIIYVDGWNNDRILIREPGAMGVVNMNLRPQGPLAMSGSRYPITEAGLHRLVTLLGTHLRRGLRLGDLEYQDNGEVLMYGRMTREIEVVFSKDKQKEYYCFRNILHLDREWKIPIRVQVYDWDNRMVEDYGYEQLRFDAALTDADFDPLNPKRKFDGGPERIQRE
jgi:outer membrane lipoprotein-sorting protein